MNNNEFDVKNDSRLGFMGDIAEKETDKQPPHLQMATEPDPAGQISCRLGDDSCAQAHAANLGNAESPGTPARDSKSLINLQRQYGNRFVQRVLAISTKSDDPSEASPEVEHTISASRGSGNALDSSVQKQMESSFKADFSGVRVHHDTRSDALNQSLNSRAFTTGKDLFFKQGEYNPGSASGRELLAHELTHVVQQNGDEVRTKLTVGAPGDRYEQEADRVARAVVSEENQPVQRETLRRIPDEDDEAVLTKAESSALQRQTEDEELQE